MDAGTEEDDEKMWTVCGVGPGREPARRDLMTLQIRLDDVAHGVIAVMIIIRKSLPLLQEHSRQDGLSTILT